MSGIPEQISRIRKIAAIVNAIIQVPGVSVEVVHAKFFFTEIGLTFVLLQETISVTSFTNSRYLQWQLDLELKRSYYLLRFRSNSMFYCRGLSSIFVCSYFKVKWSTECVDITILARIALCSFYCGRVIGLNFHSCVRISAQYSVSKQKRRGIIDLGSRFIYKTANRLVCLLWFVLKVSNLSRILVLPYSKLQSRGKIWTNSLPK